MCGLTGFARPADDDATAVAFCREAMTKLMDSIESRGRHATGIATIGATPETNYLWKVASTASMVLKSDKWKEIMEQRITGKTLVAQGHTRFATQDNAKKDECAHPFQIGDIVGAHNGIISNWISLEKQAKKHEMKEQMGLPWQVDSEAIFALLNVMKNPLDALEPLDGYFALSWTKGPHLYLARSGQGSLYAAYVPELKTLFWNSTQGNLRSVFAQMKLKPENYDLTEVAANTIFRFSPGKFGEKPRYTSYLAEKPWGSEAISRWEAEERTGSGVHAGYRGGYSTKHGSVPPYNPPTSSSSSYTRPGKPLEKKDVNTIIKYPDGSGWDMVNGKEIPADVMKDKHPTIQEPRTYSLRDMDDLIAQLLVICRAQSAAIRELREQNAQMEYNIDVMWEAMAENGLLDHIYDNMSDEELARRENTDMEAAAEAMARDIMRQEEEGGPSLRALPDPNDDGSTDTPYRETTAVQQSLPLDAIEDMERMGVSAEEFETLACSVCGKPSNPREEHRLYLRADKRWIGESCILAAMEVEHNARPALLGGDHTGPDTGLVKH